MMQPLLCEPYVFSLGYMGQIQTLILNGDVETFFFLFFDTCGTDF